MIYFDKEEYISPNVNNNIPLLKNCTLSSFCPLNRTVINTGYLVIGESLFYAWFIYACTNLYTLALKKLIIMQFYTKHQ